MTICTGDLVTRRSHGHDVLFRAGELLQGSNGAVALLTSCLGGWTADAPVSDLVPVPAENVIAAVRRELLTRAQY